MNMNDYWSEFELTGSIQSYLKYKEILCNKEDQVTSEEGDNGIEAFEGEGNSN